MVRECCFAAFKFDGALRLFADALVCTLETSEIVLHNTILYMYGKADGHTVLCVSMCTSIANSMN